MAEVSMDERRKTITSAFNDQFEKKGKKGEIESSTFHVDEIYDQDGFVIVKDWDKDQNYKVGMKTQKDKITFDKRESWLQGRMVFEKAQETEKKARMRAVNSLMGAPSEA